MVGTAVSRGHLLIQLAAEEERGCAVFVVAAPAGAGKTMLLAQQTKQLRSSGRPAAWLSLADEDNDSRTLWSGILAACRRAARGVHAPTEQALAALKPPAVVGDGFVDAFIRQPASCPEGCGWSSTTSRRSSRRPPWTDWRGC